MLNLKEIKICFSQLRSYFSQESFSHLNLIIEELETKQLEPNKIEKYDIELRYLLDLILIEKSRIKNIPLMIDGLIDIFDQLINLNL